MRPALVHLLALALAVALSSISIQARAQGAERVSPAFEIREFVVEGNTVLSAREIERAISSFLGESRHFSDVEAARKALEDAYQKAGYQTVFVEIPEQKVVAGTIRLHVLEGKIGQTRVTGSRY